MNIGRTLIVAGAVLIAIGLLFLAGDKLPIRFGRLPGDITLRGRNSVFYVPLTTCILLSAILSLVLWLFHRR
ncbi:MAG TPA: DUF2905 domain-containing protein [Bryobacteraceae bacterium]|nr:DUF2905 domain-containing protein [Bryobacteraceae bacterium]